MSELSATFRQSPQEVRRYIMDYTLELNTGETVISSSVTITSPTGDTPSNFAITNITVAAGGLQVYFFASTGTNGQSYECAFLAETSLGQVFEDVILFNIQVPT